MTGLDLILFIIFSILAGVFLFIGSVCIIWGIEDKDYGLFLTGLCFVIFLILSELILIDYFFFNWYIRDLILNWLFNEL